MLTHIIIGFLAFIIALLSLVAVNTAFRKLQRKKTQKQTSSIGKLFFYQHLSSYFFPEHEYENLCLANLFAQNFLQFFFAIFAFISITQISFSSAQVQFSNFPTIENVATLFSFLIIALFISFLLCDYLARIIGNRHPEQSIKIFGPIVSIAMTLLFPFSYLFLKIFNKFPGIYLDPTHEPSQEAKQELLEIIEDFNLSTQLDPHDKKLIESVMEFKHRIAREVMVPRVDISCLSHDTTIEEAAKFLHKEGYSRTPVYKDTLDNIIGVLMYKDVLTKYDEYVQKGQIAILQSPISSLVKNVVYTPETKKISHLLQEFRKKQVHLAIIVDEYGGTEGIVTIEDILEQIVGEIADEYDETEALFVSLPEGGWLIDSRMSILAIKEDLGIEIPQDGDYDTIGGYVFHETGMIPPKGYFIRQHNFEIEVIHSNDRRVGKLRIRTSLENEKL